MATTWSQKMSLVASISRSASSRTSATRASRARLGECFHIVDPQNCVRSRSRTPGASSAAPASTPRTRSHTSRGSCRRCVAHDAGQRSPGARRAVSPRRAVAADPLEERALLLGADDVDVVVVAVTGLARRLDPRRDAEPRQQPGDVVGEPTAGRRVVDRTPLPALTWTQPSVAHRWRRNSATWSSAGRRPPAGTNFSWLRRPYSPSSSSQAAIGLRRPRASGTAPADAVS